MAWEPHSPLPTSKRLPAATGCCTSVAAAFMEHTSFLAAADTRNVLQLLGSDTRRSKVVALASGSHRVPEELRRFVLEDSCGASYSTNLDRNRYGTDTSFLATVVFRNLRTLGLCPCLASVEVLEAKRPGERGAVTSVPISQCCCRHRCHRRRRRRSRHAASPSQPPAS